MNQATAIGSSATVRRTAFTILFAISFCHLLNDMMQSVLTALYPMLRSSYALSFGQIGLLTFTYQVTSSLLQPIVGNMTDNSPKSYSLVAGMGLTLIGLVLLAFAGSYTALLVAAALIGTGSAVFHPESSRIARMASGGKHGLAQSVFQVGGNLGNAFGPLLAAFIVLPGGQSSVAWFSSIALLAMLVLYSVGKWHKAHGLARLDPRGRDAVRRASSSQTKHVLKPIIVLLVLIFSKYFYSVSLTSYYSLYLIDRFHITVQSAQIHLFVFLGAAAVGTIVGGPIGDRIGRKHVIWGSIVGVLPFTLVLPYADLFWTGVLTVPIGLILASAFPAIIVYAQELLPGRTGTVAGLFFGFGFGMAGLGAAVLGGLADILGIKVVYQICAFLPLIGVLTVFLPNIESKRQGASM